MAHSAAPGRRTSASSVMSAVRSLSYEVRHFVDESARGLGMHRSDLETLGLLIDASRHGERLTPGRLARHAGLSAAAVSALIDRLQKSGHVTRTRHEQDGRMVFLDITDEARELSRQTFAPLTDHLHAALENYSDAELELADRVIHDLAVAARKSARIDHGERPLAP